MILLLAAALLGWWAWRRRRLRPADVGAMVAVLIGARLIGRGSETAGLLLLVAAGGWLYWRRPRPAPAMGRGEAAALLGIAPDAAPEAVRAAHRRLVARVHPDIGGSAELAARVNRARDVLLARPGSQRGG